MRRKKRLIIVSRELKAPSHLSTSFRMVYLRLVMMRMVMLITIIEVCCADNEKSNCWEKEEFNVTESCHACSSHESSLTDECSATGYIETVKCLISGVVIKSCARDQHAESMSFWKFEASMIVISMISGVVVMLRMRKLDHENMDRIQRQLSAL